VLISTAKFSNAGFEVSHSPSGDLRIRDKDLSFSLTLTQAEARDLRDKLSASLDAVEPQKVTA
jgi:hypothetical protein